VLVWTLDSRGDPFTHWIRGNGAGGKVIASRAGVVLSLAIGVVEIEAREVAQPTCDCAAEPSADAGPEDCPAAVDDGAQGTVLVAVRRPSGEELPVTEAPIAADESGPLYEALEFGSNVAASMGPYLFVRTDSRIFGCGAAHESWSADSQVFDLAAGETVELLSPEERARVLGREQAAAFKLFAGDTLVDAARPEDLALTMISPVILPGAGIGLRYQFTASSSFAASDGTWGAYTRSVDVPATELPRAIAPFAAIPSALRRLPLPKDAVAIGGFTVVVRTDEQLAALASLFLAGP
jgi:hypothetical protein